MGCFPLYPPLELLHSMGFSPAVLWGLKESIGEVPLSAGHLQAYTCSVGQCLTEFVLRHGPKLFDGLLMYNACDTLRNLPEILESGFADSKAPLPLFRFHVPVMQQGQADGRSYLSEQIHLLIRSLEKTFKLSFSTASFLESQVMYRRQRELAVQLEQCVAEGKMSFTDYSRIMRWGSFLTVEQHLVILEKSFDQYSQASEAPGDRPGVIVSGILPPPAGIIDMIEGAGLRILGNDIAMFRRMYGYSPEPAEDPADFYFDFYGNHYPCTTILARGDERIEVLKRMVRDRNAMGFVFAGELFCEYEYFELPYLRKTLLDQGTRTLSLDFSLQDQENMEAYRTRIESFAEMLRGF